MSKSTEDKVSKESEILQERFATMSNARLEGETFEEYKERRTATNHMIKQYLKGRRI